MVWVSVEEIQRDLSVYLQRVETGETLIIVQAGRPVAEIKPIVSGAKPLRPFGLCAGEFNVPDDFDAPLPEDLLNAFEGHETPTRYTRFPLVHRCACPLAEWLTAHDSQP